MKLYILTIACALAVVPNLVASQKDEALSKDYDAVDANKPVVCLLPGRVRKLGGSMTYLERRRPKEMSASECEIRGGEYTLYDRANSENALALWREAADQGDATAQVYVGEIYEKGWVGKPDYATAAKWYRKAADQGDRRGQRRLAYFYENGLGVTENREQALGLWRDALGLKEDLVLASEVDAAKSQSQRRIDSLLGQLEQQNIQTGRMQRNLDEALTALQEQSNSVQREEADTRRVEQELSRSRQTSEDPLQIRQLEAQLAAGQNRIEDQQIAIQLLEADVEAQQAQVQASIRRANVRDTQLAKAQANLIVQSSRGDALLRQLQDKDLQLKALEQQVAQAETQLRSSKNKQDQLAGQVDSASSADRGELERELLLAQQEVAKREGQMKTLVAQAAQQRADFKTQLERSKLRESDISTALASSQKEKEALAQTLAQTQSNMKRIDEQLTQARYKVADQETAMQNLQDQLDVLDGRDGGDDSQRSLLANKLGEQEKAIAALKTERDNLIAGWQEMEKERNSARNNLSDEVDTSSWLNVELESAGSKMANLRDELRAAELALTEANFSKKRFGDDLNRLEEDLALSRKRGAADRRVLEEQLLQTRLRLAEATSGVAQARKTANRRASDFDYYGDQQQSRSLAAGSVRAVPASINQIPKGAKKLHYKGIIIANYDYEYLPDLSSPPSDANQLKQLLEAAYGFEVKVHINLNRSEMYKILAQVREFEEKDSVLVYYVGHGRMDEFGDGYWLPTDYRSSKPLSDAISSSDLTQTMNQSKAKHLMVMADSCYSGALARTSDPKIRKSVPALMNYWMANKSRTVLTSGGLKPVMNDGPDKHSIFASALLKALEMNGGAINGEMLHAQVYDLVRQSAAQLGYLDQKPQFSAIEDAGHENGQFVFLKPGTIRL
ncbi:MAG: hypothetical protein ACI9NT_000365 [Bacteroidia bacterium]|jgi:hypothetical protein